MPYKGVAIFNVRKYICLHTQSRWDPIGTILFFTLARFCSRLRKTLDFHGESATLTAW